MVAPRTALGIAVLVVGAVVEALFASLELTLCCAIAVLVVLGLEKQSSKSVIISNYSNWTFPMIHVEKVSSHNLFWDILL
jgi:hypothetical protein